MKVLGIESSCDETAAAVVEDGKRLLSNVVHSQIDIHAEYGGVVPEVAARSHIEMINPVINKALDDAGCTWDDIDAIAVTYAPGLIGSLLVGTLAARTLAVLHGKPLYPIHHVEAHVYANFITEQQSPLDLTLPSKQPTFPMLALIVSGGHSQLVLFRDHGDYELLGQTGDDAVGEAFDKVAKILGLPYPGGPSIAKAALEGDAYKYQLPKARVQGSYDFSFSGLKTAVLRAVQREVGVDFTYPSHQLPELVSERQRVDFAASFQRIAIETLVDKAEKAFQDFHPASVVIAGGVAANQELRRQLSERLPITIEYAPMQLCTDNAAMIGALGYYAARHSAPTPPQDLEVIPSLSMTKTAWKSVVKETT
ncbi:tRNA (adenosine(37)-N6)-threonylcarbamoyltransferase complex transferase subunit TsaD [Candidatus Saccharibacteria bacterium 32-50-13]|nr:MAG: tRNA (adenosine(37)-N6)-threonylcarbamoyltransferase complex transferase subunit TsaD [Candidatus Saccharibacteria bacterium 32-50-13]